MTSASQVSSASHTRQAPWRVLILVAVAVLLLVPIWTVAFPPLLDYPNHLARAFVLAHLHDPAFHFSDFYRGDWGWYPYLGMDASLAVLDRIFPIETAGRVFLSLCALALPAAAWFFLAQVNPVRERREDSSIDACATAAWVLLLAYNVFFLEGFLNFDLSLAIGMVALGLWLRWLAATGIWRWLAALVAFTALYLAHLVGFFIAGLVVVAYLAFARRSLREWLGSAALAAPGVAFYLTGARLGMGANKVIFHGFSDKIDSLGMILHGYWGWLDWLSLVLLPVWFALAAWRNPEFRWNKTWLALAAFLFAAYWAIPWMLGEASDLDIRVLPMLFVVILAAARTGRRARVLALIPLVLFGVRSASVISHFRGVQPELAGLAGSFDAVPRNALVFQVVEGDEDPIDRPFTHFWAYGVIRRGWFSPYLADEPGQTPMRITYESYTSDGFWDLIYDQPPDWEKVRSDYDYVWAYDVPRFAPALAQIGDKVYSYGALEVYRIRKPPAVEDDPHASTLHQGN